jgi:hypothetical protein
MVEPFAEGRRRASLAGSLHGISTPVRDIIRQVCAEMGVNIGRRDVRMHVVRPCPTFPATLMGNMPGFLAMVLKLSAR